MEFEDGRVFHYSEGGASDLAIAKLMQQAVVQSNHDVDITVTTDATSGLYPAIGDKAITITTQAVLTKDQYKDGYIFVDSGTGLGQMAQIKSHPAESTGAASCKITLYDHDALVTALDATSDVGLRLNLYDGVIINPQAAATGVPIGVTPRAVDVSVAKYFWLQTWGPCLVLTNGSLLVGKAVCPSATTDGAIDVYPLNSADASGQQPVVGWVMTVASSTEYSLVYLTIAP